MTSPSEILGETICSCEHKINELRSYNNFLTDRVRNLQLQSDILSTQLDNLEDEVREKQGLILEAREIFLGLIMNYGPTPKLNRWLEKTKPLVSLVPASKEADAIYDEIEND